MTKNNQRKNKGSMLVLISVTLCVLVVPLLILLGQCSPTYIARARAQSTVEAASLLAASELSRIVIEDQNFGFVSLSNYPAIGTATRTRDGDPSPVLGINTLISTNRQATLLANQLQNPVLTSLVDSDHGKMQDTVTAMNNELQHAVCEGSIAHDANGNVIEISKDVETFLRNNLPSNMKLEWLTVEAGYLHNGGSTIVSAPLDCPFGAVRIEQTTSGKYRPFIDIPADSRHYEFAAAGPRPALVPTSDFGADSTGHIRSIVRVRACLVLTQPVELKPFTNSKIDHLQLAACSQAYSQEDVGPEGVMTLRLSGSSTQGIGSWRELLQSSGFHDRKVSSSTSLNGDYLLDRNAKLRQAVGSVSTNVRLVTCFYDWLRNTHTKARLTSLLTMLDQPIHSTNAGLLCYEVTTSGDISSRMLNANPFLDGAVAENQTITVSDTQLGMNPNVVMIMTDNVQNLGNKFGGKHAGLPLVGKQIDWCERPEYSGDEEIAKTLGKGRLGTKLVLESSSPPALPFQQTTSPLSCMFGSLYGALPLQPRKTIYSGGLAVNIEIGGLSPVQTGTDISRMRALKR